MEELSVFDEQRINIAKNYSQMADDSSNFGSELSLEHRCQDIVNECMKFKNIIFQKIEKVRLT